jgi:hypothetical protein
MSNFYNYIREIRQKGSMREVDWYDTTNDMFRLMYSTLGWLVRHTCQRLIITEKHVLYEQAGVIHRHHNERSCEGYINTADGPGCTTYREAMREIYEHDERVRMYFQRVDETPESVVYNILSAHGDKVPPT